MLRGVYLTPDDPPAGVEFETWVLAVPDISEIKRAVKGALLFLSYESVWTKSGTLSARETSWLVKEMLNGISSLDWLLGVPVPVYTTLIPDNLIVANGQTVQRDDFPDLWEITPVSMRTATTLTVPDLREKFILASGDSVANNSAGGEAEHTLTVDEIPSHSHGFTQYTFGVDIESVGVPDPTGVGNPRIPENTQSTGGGMPHNNMPPYYAMVYCIVGRTSP